MTPLSINDPYYQRLQQARRNKWRCNKSEASLLASYAVDRGEIAPEFKARFEHNIQFGELMRLDDGRWVCTTCGGNCGQCGQTDMLGNPGFSFDRIVAGINPEGHKPLDLEARPGAWWNLIRNKTGLSFIGAYIALIFAVAIVLGLTLSGCTSVPGTYVGSGTCAQCIGPYDVTLSSHREALLRP